MAGHIVAVMGGKGGVGKSVFTANFAISYLQDFKQRPLIVDLDMASLGDLNNLLTLRHIDRAQIGFHRPNDEVRFNEQFATGNPGQR